MYRYSNVTFERYLACFIERESVLSAACKGESVWGEGFVLFPCYTLEQHAILRFVSERKGK